MEVDVPSEDHVPSRLKRSNSAPMLNFIQPTTTVKNNISTSNLSNFDGQSFTIYRGNLFNSKTLQDSQRIRRYSTSHLSVNSPTTPIKNRLTQIKQEESLTPITREVQHERNVHVQMQMSHSCEDLSLCDKEDGKCRPKSLTEQLHITTTLYASSPSPTRSMLAGKQCFSPSQQQIVPSPLPSPTRRPYRRSLSPIASLRPSSIGPTKRKMEIDSQYENWCSPNKRMSFGSANQYTPERQDSTGNFTRRNSSTPSSAECEEPMCQSSYIFRPVRNSTESVSSDSESVLSPIRYCTPFNLSPLVTPVNGTPLRQTTENCDAT
ncbi:DgyrCDS8552 [Dimorphilus gyrociliatus]|uniref:DgyrCDS8552 n=1 Tax=Dimorphilus gyrociliatus TaxID=2664684 RepID=A0A7I8VVH8_9ANNE|nr:DgyrCDS8552 [Dimorphilus gyrociliatus]